MVAASTSTSTWPGPGAGAGNSTSSRTSPGSPIAVICSLSMTDLRYALRSDLFDDMKGVGDETGDGHRLGDEGGGRADDGLGGGAHAFGHEPLGVGRDGIVVLRNQIPRWLGFPAGGGGVFGKGSQRERPLSGEHDLGDIDGYVCAEGLAETVLRDVEVGPLRCARRVVSGGIGSACQQGRREGLLHAGAAFTLLEPERGQVYQCG